MEKWVTLQWVKVLKKHNICLVVEMTKKLKEQTLTCPCNEPTASRGNALKPQIDSRGDGSDKVDSLRLRQSQHFSICRPETLIFTMKQGLVCSFRVLCYLNHCFSFFLSGAFCFCRRTFITIAVLTHLLHNFDTLLSQESFWLPCSWNNMATTSLFVCVSLFCHLHLSDQVSLSISKWLCCCKIEICQL